MTTLSSPVSSQTLAPVSGRLAGQAGWTKAAARYGIPHLRLRQVARVICELSAKEVLDVGCSSGFLRTLLPGIAYTGVDFISPDAEPEFPFHQVDINREELPPSLVNQEVIACSGALEYVADLPRVVSGLVSRLRPGGHLVATYYNFNHLSRLSAVIRGKSFWVHPDWRNFLSPSDFAEMLGKCGLKVQQVLPSFHSFKPSPRIEETVDLPCVFPRRRPWSHLTAHQFLFVARKPGH